MREMEQAGLYEEQKKSLETDGYGRDRSLRSER